MRKITLFQIGVFSVSYLIALGAAIFSTLFVFGSFPLGDFRGVVLVFIGIVFFLAYLIMMYRLFLKIMPLKPGEIPQGSRQEFIYHVHLLFFLLGFDPFLRSNILFPPLLRVIYLCLGAKLGDNTYTAGVIRDPIFVKIGSNCLLGNNSILIPHAIENEDLSHLPIEMGDNITIGASAIVFQNVKIGNNALVGAGSVVTKGTVIGDNEIWGGVPARFIKKKNNAGED